MPEESDSFNSESDLDSNSDTSFSDLDDIISQKSKEQQQRQRTMFAVASPKAAVSKETTAGNAEPKTPKKLDDMIQALKDVRRKQQN